VTHDRERRPGSPTRGASSGSGGSSESIAGKRTLVEGLAPTGILPQEPASTTPDGVAPTGDGAARQQVDEPVAGDYQPGFIDHGDGANIRNRPAELAGSQALVPAPLPPATRVFVSGRHPQTSAWWYVTAFLPEAILRGYVQGFRVTTDLPEPTAKLHQVRAGDTAEDLAVQEFSSTVRDGHDLRYYENVLLFVNQQRGRAGIAGSYQGPGLIGSGANNIHLVAGHRIWLVSPAYARALENVVPAGSLTGGAVAKAKRLVGHIEDLVKSVTESPNHFGEVAGEYAQAIRDHMAEIIGIMAGFIMAEAASAFLAATPTGVGQIAAVAIHLGLAAFGAVGLMQAGVAALEHAIQWLTLAWTAKGKESQIATASTEFLKMLVSLAMAALSYMGIKGNMGKAVAIADKMPPMLPAYALAGGREIGGAGTGSAVATGVPGAAGPFGTAMAMSTKGEGESGASSEKDQGGKDAEHDSRTQKAQEAQGNSGKLTPGKNFKEHFITKKTLLEQTLGIRFGKLKDGGGEAFLKAISDGIGNGTFKYIGQGTLKKGMEAMNIYRGQGLTIVTKINGEWVTLLQSGEGIDLAIQMVP
jgi:hypothetical protein